MYTFKKTVLIQILPLGLAKQSSTHPKTLFFFLQTGEKSGTVVPMSSEDTNTALHDPHDYDEVPMDESNTPSRSPLPPLPPPSPSAAAAQNTARVFSMRPLPEIVPEPELGGGLSEDAYSQV